MSGRMRLCQQPPTNIGGLEILNKTCLGGISCIFPVRMKMTESGHDHPSVPLVETIQMPGIVFTGVCPSLNDITLFNGNENNLIAPGRNGVKMIVHQKHVMDVPYVLEYKLFRASIPMLQIKNRMIFELVRAHEKAVVRTDARSRYRIDYLNTTI